MLLGQVECLPDLTQDLGLPHHHGVYPRRDTEQVLNRISTGPGIGVLPVVQVEDPLVEVDGLPQGMIGRFPVPGQPVELRPVAGGKHGKLREDLPEFPDVGVERAHLVRTQLDLVPDIRRGRLVVRAEYDEIHRAYEN